mmetsp:Transcript_6696/g.16781  ORF Transcript_6696/g.16781 Transcript_6696/m.16781 type:complete len:204 (-) Transcript_6696:3484-4095(-)
MPDRIALHELTLLRNRCIASVLNQLRCGVLKVVLNSNIKRSIASLIALADVDVLFKHVLNQIEHSRRKGFGKFKLHHKVQHCVAVVVSYLHDSLRRSHQNFLDNLNRLEIQEIEERTAILVYQHGLLACLQYDRDQFGAPILETQKNGRFTFVVRHIYFSSMRKQKLNPLHCKGFHFIFLHKQEIVQNLFHILALLIINRRSF